jgi:hypothetical protein
MKWVQCPLVKSLKEEDESKYSCYVKTAELPVLLVPLNGKMLFNITREIESNFLSFLSFLPEIFSGH